MTHREIMKEAGTTRGCSANDLFLVSEGLQCGNCLAVTMDHGKTWHKPEELIKDVHSDGHAEDER